MISITTKTGDKGDSGLANGQRTGKDELVFEVIGTLDELNSWLGLIAAKLPASTKTHQQHIFQIQETLFHVGAEVALSPKTKLTTTQLKKLETWSNQLQSQMDDAWHSKFLLPGGTELGAFLDITRTVCRRCERVAVAYSRQTPVAALVLKYLNRLSDYLYLLRCQVNATASYAEQPFIADKD